MALAPYRVTMAHDDNEGYDAADIQEISENVENDYDGAATEKLVCMPDVEKLPDEFKEGNSVLMDDVRANWLVLTR